MLLTVSHAKTISSTPLEFDPAVGWESDFSSTDTGVIINGGVVGYSSPAVGELDGDPTNGQEIVVASEDGFLHLYGADGRERWRSALPSVTCGSSSRGNKTLSSPAIGDLDGDGVVSIVIGYGGIANRGCDGGVAAYRADSGSAEWIFSLKEFAKTERFWTRSNTVFSTPALADTDNDGKLEIGFGSFDRNVYLLEYDGSVRWYYNAADTVWSSGAFSDVNGDGTLEFVIGTDITGNNKLRPITKDGGYVYAFRTTRRPGRNKRIGFRDPSAYLWMQWFNQVVFSSPVIANVISANSGDEVIIASGCYFPERNNDKRGKAVSVLSARTGAVLRTLPIEACSSSSVAVADLNRDGMLDIVTSVNGHRSVGGSGRSSLVAHTPETGEQLWSVIPRERGGNDSWGGHFTSPIIADLDQNGSLEVLIANRAAVSIFSGHTGTPLSCPERECSDDQRLAYTASTLRASPAVGDLDGDGLYELMIGGGNSAARGSGFIYTWTGFEGSLGSEPENGAKGELPWPTARGDNHRRGVFPPEQ